MATAKKKRAPRSVWLVMDGEGSLVDKIFPTRKAAKEYANIYEQVVGPFVLAERVGTK